MQTTVRASTRFRLLRADEIAIPQEFREELGLDERTMVFLRIVDGELRIRPVRFNQTPSEKGSPGLRSLYDYFAPVREEILASGTTQEELYELIDEAIAEVRAEQRAKRQCRLFLTP